MAKQLPAPDPDENPKQGAKRRGSYRRQSKQIQIPDVDQILQMLMQLNSAVTVGVISVKEANLIERNLRTILDVQMKRQGSHGVGPGYEGLVEICRRAPWAINALEPFLTDEVFNALMADVAEAPDEED